MPDKPSGPAASASAPNGGTHGAKTAGEAYAERLNTLQSKKWKKWLNVQAPYRANLRRYRLGRTLDVGCGNGRNLAALGRGSVGVDHNPHLVRTTRELGLEAYTTDEFFADASLSAPGAFDAILASHLIEHLRYDEALDVMRQYLPCVRPGGRILLITPQERGHASDPTHVAFSDFAVLRRLTADLGLDTTRERSFPFPRLLGKLFIYNEFNLEATVPVA